MVGPLVPLKSEVIASAPEPQNVNVPDLARFVNAVDPALIIAPCDAALEVEHRAAGAAAGAAVGRRDVAVAGRPRGLTAGARDAGRAAAGPAPRRAAAAAAPRRSARAAAARGADAAGDAGAAVGGRCMPRLAQASEPSAESKKIAVMARIKIVSKA